MITGNGSLQKRPAARATLPWTAFVVPTFLLLACTHTTPPQVVSITYKPVLPYCYVNELPEPPKMLEANYEEEDIQRRVFVHFLTGNEIIQYEQELSAWAAKVRECLMLVMGSQ